MMRLTTIAVLSVSLALSACGSDKSPLSGVAKTAFSTLFSRSKQAPLITAVLRSRLTPEVRAQIGDHLLIIEIPKQKVAAVVVYVTQNANDVTWKAEDGVAVYTKGGMVTGSRGIGFDLMTANIDGPLSIITGRGTGIASRVHRSLDGENQEIITRFECRYVKQKLLVSETCETKGLTIDNYYLLNKNREIQSSRQWIGERNGYMLVEAPIFND